MKVLFVCTGNICRSPMAEAILNSLAQRDGLQDFISAESAGISALDGDAPTPQSVDVMAWRDIDITGHRSRRVTHTMLDHADIVACMTEGHRRAIEGASAEYSGKSFLIGELAEAARRLGPATGRELNLEAEKVRDEARDGESSRYEVGDPYGGTQGEYDITAQTLEVAIGDLWKSLRSAEGEQRN